MTLMRHQLFTATTTVLGFFLILGLLTTTDHLKQQQLAMVQATCETSQVTQSADSKLLCGEMQTLTNTKYMCSGDHNCWVEEK